MLWACCYHTERCRAGLTSVEADDEQTARLLAAKKIESKYFWQGKCVIDSCRPAATKFQPPEKPK